MTSTLQDLNDGKHITFLDGVRGFAVSYVLLYHFFPKHLSTYDTSGLFHSFYYLWDSFWLMGWSGVDLFFVLSGFLITGILYKTKSSKGYFKNFYIRRILRIFPIYYLMLLVYLVIIPISKGSGIPQESIFYWLYLSNFDTEFSIPMHPVLVVAWSLSIEEQYYMIYPALVYFLNYKHWINVLLFLIILSVLLRFFVHHFELFKPRQIYHFTLAHFDGIAFGGLLRLLLFRYEQYKNMFKWYIRGLPFILMIGVGIALYGTNSVLQDFVQGGRFGHVSFRPEMYLFGYFFNSLCYGGIIIWCVLKEGALLRVFNSKVLRTIGKYSYAMYLFQYIAMHFFKVINGYLLIQNKIVVGLFVFLICFLMAKFSWNVYEGPISKLKVKFTS